ncbi:uncharacterized protein A4U43_C09F16060 [Asparagus officinalis]|uniref:Uncharacterized protein n=1 Tax=Asparagus officinalis TaxID=4686 RepID=A0A5P1E8C4_ASPOF|nr:uncharacterized protein A4U43_C09F16060 [Asparagus officinalis]
MLPALTLPAQRISPCPFSRTSSPPADMRRHRCFTSFRPSTITLGHAHHIPYSSSRRRRSRTPPRTPSCPAMYRLPRRKRPTTTSTVTSWLPYGQRAACPRPTSHLPERRSLYPRSPQAGAIHPPVPGRSCAQPRQPPPTSLTRPRRAEARRSVGRFRSGSARAR